MVLDAKSYFNAIEQEHNHFSNTVALSLSKGA